MKSSKKQPSFLRLTIGIGIIYLIMLTIFGLIYAGIFFAFREMADDKMVLIAILLTVLFFKSLDPLFNVVLVASSFKEMVKFNSGKYHSPIEKPTSTHIKNLPH